MNKVVKGIYRVTDIMTARDLKGGAVAIDIGDTLEVLEVAENILKLRLQQMVDEMLIINDIESFIACTTLVYSKDEQEEQVKTEANIFNKVNIGFYHNLEKYASKSHVDDAAIGAIFRFWAHSEYRAFLVDQFTNVQVKNSNK